jgi:hypothetical protein
MRGAFLGCFLFAMANEGFAHRVDEYLQATRIAVATHRIDFTFDLTPGVAVAGQVIELTDQDRDGRLSGEEESAYARRFLQDLNISLDGKAVTLSVTTISFPTVREMQSGTGVIRIRATSVIGSLGAGRHALRLTNRHLPAISAYLVNALRSLDPVVEIGKQTRDDLQQNYRLEFRVRPAGP